MFEPKDTQPQAGPQAKRRSFFKRAAIGTVIAGLAAGIGISAFAHGGDYARWHRGGFMAMDPAQMDRRVDKMLRHAYVEIDATEEQKARLDPIVKQAVGDLMPLRQSMRDARAKAIELLMQDNVDRAAIESLRAQQIQLADSASRRLAQALADVAEVLTPEQKRDIAERMQRRHARWHGTRGG